MTNKATLYFQKNAVTFGKAYGIKILNNE